jgi:hypothetical protein
MGRHAEIVEDGVTGFLADAPTPMIQHAGVAESAATGHGMAQSTAESTMLRAVRTEVLRQFSGILSPETLALADELRADPACVL